MQEAFRQLAKSAENALDGIAHYIHAWQHTTRRYPATCRWCRLELTPPEEPQ